MYLVSPVRCYLYPVPDIAAVNIWIISTTGMSCCTPLLACIEDFSLALAVVVAVVRKCA